MYLTGVGCCGIGEMTGCASDFRLTGGKNFDAFVDMGRRNSKAFLFFSLADYQEQWTNAEKFQAFVEEQKLGKVTYIGENINPNSGQNLRMWVWAVDRRACQRWQNPRAVDQRRAQVEERMKRVKARASAAAKRGWETRRRRLRAVGL